MSDFCCSIYVCKNFFRNNILPGSSEIISIHNGRLTQFWKKLIYSVGVLLTLIFTVLSPILHSHNRIKIFLIIKWWWNIKWWGNFESIILSIFDENLFIKFTFSETSACMHERGISFAVCFIIVLLCCLYWLKWKMPNHTKFKILSLLLLFFTETLPLNFILLKLSPSFFSFWILKTSLNFSPLKLPSSFFSFRIIIFLEHSVSSVFFFFQQNFPILACCSVSKVSKLSEAWSLFSTK